MAETTEERRTVGREGSEATTTTQADGEHDDTKAKKTNKENGRDAAAGTSSEAESRSGWKVNLKATGIVTAVLLLSYNILAITDPRPSQFSVVITKMAPQHCGLKLPARLQNMILDKHNEIRSKVALGQYLVDDEFLPPAAGMPRLTWDCELELEAQNQAAKCDLEADKKMGKTGGLEGLRGENAFYFRTGNQLDYSDGVLRGIERMGDEIAIAGIKRVQLGRFDKRIGHATQIMWGVTRRVGCAVQECSARQDGSLDGQKYNVAVCKYYPTGNVFRSSALTPIYSVGEPGSSCSDGTLPDPTSGLCVAATWQEKKEEEERRGRE